MSTDHTPPFRALGTHRVHVSVYPMSRENSVLEMAREAWQDTTVEPALHYLANIQKLPVRSEAIG